MRERLVIAIVALAAIGLSAVLAYGDRMAVGVSIAGPRVTRAGRSSSEPPRWFQLY